MNEHSYKTKQRKAVLSCLRESGRCVSAEEIIKLVNGVSKTTVYRTLEHFVSEGRVTRFKGDVGQSAVYRYSEGHIGHFHLHCTECGITECMEGQPVREFGDSIHKARGFTINQSQTVLYGICNKCAEKGGKI